MNEVLDDSLIFAIPLKAKCNSANWPAVSSMLSATMNSVFASTDSRFHIIVVGHDKPEIPHFEDSRATFVPAPFDPPKTSSGTDKWLKRLLIGAWVRNRIEDRVRLMFLDADDLVHKQLTQMALQFDKQVFLVLGKGYRYDMRNGNLQPINRSFDRRCGSCFLPSFHRDELPSQWADENCIYGRFRKHADFRGLSEELGKAVEPVNLHAVVYMTNHTDSLEYHKKGMRSDLIKCSLSYGRVSTILRDDFAYDRR
jgi:hypothetical protein